MWLDDIKERVERANEGPWFFDSYSTVWCKAGDDSEAVAQSMFLLGGDTATEQGADNCKFIAHAREDIPYLLGLLDEVVGAGNEIVALDAGGYDPAQVVATDGLGQMNKMHVAIADLRTILSKIKEER